MPPTRRAGIQLQNQGNTCYMNSALQLLYGVFHDRDGTALFEDAQVSFAELFRGTLHISEFLDELKRFMQFDWHVYNDSGTFLGELFSSVCAARGQDCRMLAGLTIHYDDGQMSYVPFLSQGGTSLQDMISRHFARYPATRLPQFLIVRCAKRYSASQLSEELKLANGARLEVLGFSVAQHSHYTSLVKLDGQWALCNDGRITLEGDFQDAAYRAEGQFCALALVKVIQQPTQIEKGELFSRQVTLFDPQCVARSAVGLVGSGCTLAEIAKNLLCIGVGNLLLLRDKAKVRAADVSGAGFCFRETDLGNSRTDVLARWMRSKGTHFGDVVVLDDWKAIEARSPTIVVVAGNMSSTITRDVVKACDTLGIPVMGAEVKGLIGSFAFGSSKPSIRREPPVNTVWNVKSFDLETREVELLLDESMGEKKLARNCLVQFFCPQNPSNESAPVTAVEVDGAKLRVELPEDWKMGFDAPAGIFLRVVPKSKAVHFKSFTEVVETGKDIYGRDRMNWVRLALIALRTSPRTYSQTWRKLAEADGCQLNDEMEDFFIHVGNSWQAEIGAVHAVIGGLATQEVMKFITEMHVPFGGYDVDDPDRARHQVYFYEFVDILERVGVRAKLRPLGISPENLPIEPAPQPVQPVEDSDKKIEQPAESNTDEKAAEQAPVKSEEKSTDLAPPAPISAFVINGFYMAMREKYTKPSAKIHYFVVQWDGDALSWKDFRGKVLGATDPAQACEGSIRNDILLRWEELGLTSKPDVGDNGVHASASPFESLTERMNWLGVQLEEDEFGQQLLAKNIDKKVVMAWTKDPQVDLEGKKVSCFDSLEDTNSSECVGICQKIAGVEEKSQVIESSPATTTTTVTTETTATTSATVDATSIPPVAEQATDSTATTSEVTTTPETTTTNTTSVATTVATPAKPNNINTAFVFIKPHAAGSALVAAAVKKGLQNAHITVLTEGEIDGPTIESKQYIDNHYYAIANKAALSKPADLNPPPKAQEEFLTKFGLTWKDALAQSQVFNAVDACKKLDIDGVEMDHIWGVAKKSDLLVKFGGGFYAGKVLKKAPLPVANEPVSEKPAEKAAEQTPVKADESPVEQTPVKPDEKTAEQTPVKPDEKAAEQTPVKPDEKAAEQTPVKPDEKAAQQTPVESVTAESPKATPNQRVSESQSVTIKLPEEVQNDFPDLEQTWDVGMRYAFEEEIMERVRRARLVVVGAGATGCELLKNLTQMGVATHDEGLIHVLDNDTVTASNLSRQFLYNTAHVTGNIGKAQAACAELKQIQFALNCEFTITRLQATNPFNCPFTTPPTALVSCVDSFKARDDLDQIADTYGIPLFDCGTRGIQGNVIVVYPKKTTTLALSVPRGEVHTLPCTPKVAMYLTEHCIHRALWLLEATEKTPTLFKDIFETEVRQWCQSEEHKASWAEKHVPRPLELKNAAEAELRKRFETALSTVSETKTATFDKDRTDHMEFVHSAACLYSTIFSVPQPSLLDVRLVAGKMDSAVITTTAIVSGLTSLNLLRHFVCEPDERTILGYNYQLTSTALLNPIPRDYNKKPLLLEYNVTPESTDADLCREWKMEGMDLIEIHVSKAGLNTKLTITCQKSGPLLRALRAEVWDASVCWCMVGLVRGTEFTFKPGVLRLPVMTPEERRQLKREAEERAALLKAEAKRLALEEAAEKRALEEAAKARALQEAEEKRAQEAEAKRAQQELDAKLIEEAEAKRAQLEAEAKLQQEAAKRAQEELDAQSVAMEAGEKVPQEVGGAEAQSDQPEAAKPSETKAVADKTEAKPAAPVADTIPEVADKPTEAKPAQSAPDKTAAKPVQTEAAISSEAKEAVEKSTTKEAAKQPAAKEVAEPAATNVLPTTHTQEPAKTEEPAKQPAVKEAQAATESATETEAAEQTQAKEAQEAKQPPAAKDAQPAAEEAAEQPKAKVAEAKPAQEAQEQPTTTAAASDNKIEAQPAQLQPEVTAPPPAEPKVAEPQAGEPTL